MVNIRPTRSINNKNRVLAIKVIPILFLVFVGCIGSWLAVTVAQIRQRQLQNQQIQITTEAVPEQQWQKQQEQNHKETLLAPSNSSSSSSSTLTQTRNDIDEGKQALSKGSHPVDEERTITTTNNNETVTGVTKLQKPSREEIRKTLHEVLKDDSIKKDTGNSTQQQKQQQTQPQPQAIIVSWLQPNDLSLWDSCVVHELCPRKRIDPLGVPRTRPEPKAIWIPGHPGSGEELLRPRLIDIIVNQRQAAKNFYTKKCIPFKANTITASCSQVHPIVAIHPPPPDRIDKFYKDILLQIRNPAYVLAAHYQEKSTKYHKGTGQVSEAEWKKYRDLYYKTSFTSWIKLIDVWKSYSPKFYNISMYVQFEKLYNPLEGPKIVEHIIQLLNSAGFDDLPILDGNGQEDNLDSEIIEDEPNTIPDNLLDPTSNTETSLQRQRKRRLVKVTSTSTTDQTQQQQHISCTQCIWYHGVNKNRLLQYYGEKNNTSTNKSFQYEYSDYLPGFTTQQRDYYVTELQTLIDGKYSSEIQLKTVLQEYLTDIQTKLRIQDV